MEMVVTQHAKLNLVGLELMESLIIKIFDLKSVEMELNSIQIQVIEMMVILMTMMDEVHHENSKLNI